MDMAEQSDQRWGYPPLRWRQLRAVLKGRQNWESPFFSDPAPEWLSRKEDSVVVLPCQRNLLLALLRK